MSTTKLKLIIIKNPFDIKKPLTILSHIIRKVTKSNWNHCAIMKEIDGVDCVSDFQSHSKFRPFNVWLNEDLKREYIILEVDSIMTDEEIEYNMKYSSSLYKGYEHIKLINQLTKIKWDFTIFKENPDRFVCSEWCWYLINGEKSNWKTPQDLFELYK